MEYTDILADIRKIIRAINLESKRIEKTQGISIPQLLTLSYLSKQDNFKSSLTGIKNFLNLNSSTVTGIISRLEKKRLIAKLPKSEDRRVSLVVLTSEGHRVIELNPDTMHEKLSQRLKSMPVSEMKRLKESIDTLVNFLGIKHLEAAPLLTDDESINLNI